MKLSCIVADESVDVRTCNALIKDGYNVYCIHDHQKCADDIKILEVAIIKEAYILTEDKDLARFITSRKNLHKGTLLVYLPGLSIAEKNSYIFNALRNHTEALLNSFAVLNREKLSIKKYFL